MSGDPLCQSFMLKHVTVFIKNYYFLIISFILLLYCLLLKGIENT